MKQPGAGRMLLRALRLRCPECGTYPLFPPLRRTRSFHDWVTPLGGCPRCGYAYEREPGYFLPAIWIVHFFAVFGLGIVIWLLLDHFWKVSLPLLSVCVLVPMLLFALLFVRHAKAIYLAFDRFVDPHGKGGDMTESAGRSNEGPAVHFGNGRHGSRSDDHGSTGRPA